MKAYLQLIRPQQWVKNLFLFLPLFFAKGIDDPARIGAVIIAFFAFSFIASSIYCYNDIHDRDADRMHEKKRLRPVASGAVGVASAYVTMAVCVLFSAICCLLLPEAAVKGVSIVIALYFVMNIAYCVRLKHTAIVDVFCIAFGFVLRIVAGGMAASVALSQWIVLMTFLIALFMAFAKRRDDVVSYRKTGVLTRHNVANYNLPFMNTLLSVIASMTMMCYIMYTISDSVMALHDSEYLYVTAVFVLAGLIRYLQLTIVAERSGSPTELVLHDRFLQLCILAWVACFALIIYM